MTPSAQSSTHEPGFRISRFHDEKGNFALQSLQDVGDCIASLATTVARVAFDYRPARPWITMKAFRFLRERLPSQARVFEWSSGTSTLWFEKQCAEVHSVEDNPEWYEIISPKLRTARLSLKSGSEYVQAITEFPAGLFDLISIDGSSRLACFELAHKYLKPGGMLLIDNTDKDQRSRGEMWQLNQWLEQRRDYAVHRFPGWIHGSWAAIETTICVHHPQI